jgi:APA family basic amino acid/polyamine antiporter
MGVLRTKSIEQSVQETEESEHQLRKSLSALDLTVFGVGVIVGTGIFVLTGIAAATQAGPAIALSFVVGGITCALAALCYAEFASTVPVAGSAYTFSYASLGELIAWIIGWDLVLELAIGAATVAKGWSGYFVELMPFKLPEAIAGEKATVNIPAVVIIAILAVVLIRGVKLTSRFNLTVTTIKIAVVLFFLVVGAFAIKSSNLSPFIPPPGQAPEPASGGDPGTPLIQVIFGLKPLAFGIPGIFFGAAVVFFAFIGFDVVATTAEEANNPQRDMPIGILGSLAICTVLYVAVSLVMNGVTSYKQLNVAAPMAKALEVAGLGWAAKIVSFGAICGITSVILILMLGQSRILFAMSRDHLLPPGLAKVHPRFGTPSRITMITAVFSGTLAALVPIDQLAGLVNIGTLFAFVLVSIGVIVLRRTQPDLPRAFRTPWVPVVPILAVLACLWLMLNLTDHTWIRFVVWMLLGFVVYFTYGMRHSRLAEQETSRDRSPSPGRRP